MIQALIVDDEQLVRKGMRLLFPWQKYGVGIAGEAASGEKALQLLRTHPVQLLLTDITMPGMSGIELIREAHRHDPAIKAVILTCHQDFDYIQEALRLGAVDYIVKTQLEEMDLDQAMERIVRSVRAEAPGMRPDNPADAPAAPNTGGWGPARWDISGIKEVKIRLRKGANRIKLHHDEELAPEVGRIGVRLETPLEGKS
ncbi:Response regulator receiver domain-containing protein [Paenibacillus sp. UNC496MF]|uniref:response regulator n=1 Tax=Paenibacillus sp. UNC496MF TaxID=1502753 RepID=UPI0008EB5217|nr:response regulator [Paenibacillus sp. UNC496MF]SFJ68992.1 Response regulator receiver domain-containing protein [Paenibacillus sp. UNC496MF]